MKKRSKKLEDALARAPAVGTCPLAPPRMALRAFLDRAEQRESDYLEAFFRAEDAERREQVLLRELGRL